MRLSTRTHLVMRTLMYCAANPGRTIRRHEIAAACNGSEHHFAQVIHALGRCGMLRTMRGRSGGVMLARAPRDIRLGEVFRLFEGPQNFADCMPAEASSCRLTAPCRLRGALARALEAFYTSLDSLTLADLTQGNVELQRLLTRGAEAGGTVRPAGSAAVAAAAAHCR